MMVDTGDFQKAIELLNDILKNETVKELLKDHIYLQLTKAYYFYGDHFHVIETVKTAKNEGLSEKDFREFLSESYMELKKYKDAHEIFLLIYNEDTNNYRNIMRLAICLALLGKVEESLDYFKIADGFIDSKNDSSFHINYSSKPIFSLHNYVSDNQINLIIVK